MINSILLQLLLLIFHALDTWLKTYSISYCNVDIITGYYSLYLAATELPVEIALVVIAKYHDWWCLPLQAPEKSDWGTGLQAMQSALELEKNVNQALLDLHKTADSHGDAQMCDFIEANYLTEQASPTNTSHLHWLKHCTTYSILLSRSVWSWLDWASDIMIYAK